MAKAAPDGPAQEATRFDPRYVVERELGRGAMGRVFLARDLRLDRLVAIKALAPGMHDERELFRLEQEARAAGSLNHPNIIAVHDIGTSESGPFIVSEYLRGLTVRQLLESGALPVRKVADLAAQLAQGLSAAHERGVIHRDLKPENLLVTDEGWLKILDFGIAKRTTHSLLPQPTPPRNTAPVGPTPSPSLLPAASPSPAALPTPTDTARVLAPPTLDPSAYANLPLGTSPGAILGTIGYMSPEQVRGQPADARSDLFSFGVIIYELLTGERAFQGPTPVATSFAILKSEPKALPGSVPADLRAVVARCLRKDPAERWQSARELAANLEELRATGEMPRVPPRRTSRRLIFAVAALVCIATGALIFAAKHRPRPPPSFKQLTFHPGAVWSARFGPDGKVYYGAAWDLKPPRLFVTTPGNPEAKKLDLPDAMLLAVSQTGDLAVLLRPRFKLFEYGRGTLATITPDGAIREWADRVDYADYSPGGALAIVREVDHQSRLEFPIGRALATSPGWLSHPRFSPDGRQIAFIEHPIFGDDGSICVVDRAGEKRVLVERLSSAMGLAWSPSGDEVWFTGAEASTDTSAIPQKVLRAVTLRGELRLLSSVGGNLQLADVSRQGRVLVTQPNPRLGVELVDAAGRPQDLTWFDHSFLDDLAADASGVLLHVGGAATQGKAEQLYYRRLKETTARHVGDGLEGSLSPDLKFAVALPARGAHELRLFPLDGGTPRTLSAGDLAVSRVVVFPDGRRLLLLAQQPGRPLRLFVRSLEDAAVTPISPEGMALARPVISADGAFVAAADAKQLHIYPVEGGSERAIAGSRPGEHPAGWDNAGMLYTFVLLAMPAEIDRIDPRTGSRTHWKTLSPASSSALGVNRVFVSRRGEQLAYNYASLSTHLYLIDQLH